MPHISVGELVEWMYGTLDDYAMAMSLSKYPMNQREPPFEGAVHDPSSEIEDTYVWTQLVKVTDRLSWVYLTEGKVSKQWILFAIVSLKKTGNPMSPEGWTRCFVDKLIQITHQHWVYRNYKVHI